MKEILFNIYNKLTSIDSSTLMKNNHIIFECNSDKIDTVMYKYFPEIKYKITKAVKSVNENKVSYSNIKGSYITKEFLDSKYTLHSKSSLLELVNTQNLLSNTENITSLNEKISHVSKILDDIKYFYGESVNTNEYIVYENNKLIGSYTDADGFTVWENHSIVSVLTLI